MSTYDLYIASIGGPLHVLQYSMEHSCRPDFPASAF